jgi:hypothetical protein
MGGGCSLALRCSYADISSTTALVRSNISLIVATHVTTASAQASFTTLSDGAKAEFEKIAS